MGEASRGSRCVEDAVAVPYTGSVAGLLDRLGVDPAHGLSGGEVCRRLTRHGPNRLREAHSRSRWSILVGQFKSIVILVLVAALVLALAFGQWPEAVAIGAVIGVHAVIGFVSESRAVGSMRALRRLAEHRACVRRDGEVVDVAAEEVVPGDVLVLDAGALVPADARIVAAEGCRANEASLTGESVPVEKLEGELEGDTPLADRRNMLFKGTTVSEGHVEAVAVATGMETELGRIADLAERAEGGATPLQGRLDRLGRRLAVVVLAITVLVAGVGLGVGRDPLLMIETAIALGVAAIPEGLPIVATIALARGMWLMARRHAIINHLPAVETLGSTTVIFTDKTGTLTENSMTLRRVITSGGDHEVRPDDGVDREPPGGAEVCRLIDVGVLCNGAGLGDEGEAAGPRGDPVEIALLEAGRAFGRRRERLLEAEPEVRRAGFDPEVMMMATYHRAEGGIRVAVKGAPRPVLEACDRVVRDGGGAELERVPLDDEAREAWLARAREAAAEGLRVLALAEKTVESSEAEAYEHLDFLGLVGLVDPPRRGVREAIDTCQRAGVKVVMVTGDQEATAAWVAEATGIVGGPGDPEARTMHGRDLHELASADGDRRARVLACTIFARVNPEQKLDLVEVYQGAGEVVAMTGDGVNDTPALRAADIGIAMGRRGTDAAKQIADMILTDDAFSSIVAAVQQGRIIFANIRRSVMFMLCTNGAEVLAVAVASAAMLPIPLRPLQILYLNVLTDVFPALALAVTAGGPEVMRDPPRDPRESILTRGHWIAVGAWSGVIGVCVLVGLLVAMGALGFDETTSVTVSFLVLGLSKLWFAFNLREARGGVLSDPIVRNPWVWASIGLCAVLLVAAVYLPGLSSILETRDPGVAGWAVALGISFVPLVVGQVLLAVRRRAGSATGSAA